MASQAESSANPIEVFYHRAAAAFTGRAESLLTMLSYSGADYVLKTPQEVGWRSDSPEPFVGMGPPFLRVDGYLGSQRGACMATLGKKLGFYPKTAADEAHALQLTMNVTDMMAEKGQRVLALRARVGKLAFVPTHLVEESLQLLHAASVGEAPQPALRLPGGLLRRLGAVAMRVGIGGARRCAPPPRSRASWR